MKRRGIAIIITIFVLVVIGILTFALINLGLKNLEHAESHLYGKKALLAAEAGVTQSLRRLKADVRWQGDGLPGRLLTGPEVYSVELVNNFSGSAPRAASNGAQVPVGTSYILSTGTAREGRVSRQVGVLVIADSAPFGWRHAIFGFSHVSLGNGQVDSYNSTQGPYPASRNPRGGAIGTNNPDPPPDTNEFPFPAQGITVGPVASVNAVQVGPSGVPAQVAPGVNPAIVSNLESPLPRALELVEPPFPSNSNNQNLRSNTTLTPGAYGDIAVGGNATVRLSPGTYVFRTLSVAGSASLRVETGVVSIYITGDGGQGDDLKLSGNSLVNTSMVPSNVQIFMGPEARQGTINGGPNVAVAILAPLADMTLNGTAGAFFGGVMAHSVTCNGQVAFHYDEALDDTGGENPQQLEVISWQRF